MLLKVLAIIFVLYTLYAMINGKPVLNAGRKSSKNNAKNDDGENIMVECRYCSTYVDKDEAIYKNGHIFCSEECAEKYLKN